MPELKEFLNPASMLTPGIAGGLTVSISMPLVLAFDLKYKWVALLVSFLFGLLLVTSFKDVTKFVRSIYCVLNTLVIFSLSVGAAVNIDAPPRAPSPPAELTAPKALPDLSSTLLRVLGIGVVHANEYDSQAVQPAEVDGMGYTGQTSAATDANTVAPNSEQWESYQQEQLKYQHEREKYEQRWSW